MKTLNKHQAKAVADALAALNNVSATVEEIRFQADRRAVIFYFDGGLEVSEGGRAREVYNTIHDFLVAYDVA